MKHFFTLIIFIFLINYANFAQTIQVSPSDLIAIDSVQLELTPDQLSSITIPTSTLLPFTIEDVVLKSTTTLAPKRIDQLQFIKNSPHFSYVQNNCIYIKSSNNNRFVDSIHLQELNVNLKIHKKDTLSAIPQLMWLRTQCGNTIHCNQFSFELGKSTLLFDSSKKLWMDTLATKTKIDNSLKSLDISEKNNYYTYCKNFNLFININKEDIQITKDGSENIVYTGENIHQNEFGITKSIFWSPNENFVAFYRMDQSNVFSYPIIDWTVRPAKNNNIKYPMAGSQSHTVTIGVFNIKTKQTIFLKTDNAETYLTNIAWSPDEKKIYVAELTRNQKDLKLNEYDAITGDFVKTLFTEHDNKYVEPLNPMIFLKNNPKQFIWQSRKNGFNHLYLHDISGKLIKQISKGKWEVKNTVGFNANGTVLFYHSNQENPVSQDFYSINLITFKTKRITSGSGFHTCKTDSTGNFIFDVFSNTSTPKKYNLINLETNKEEEIYKSPNPLEHYELGDWKLFTIKNSEKTELFCRIFKPTNFDSTKKYPVIVYVYNGPHSQLVTNTWLAGGELWYQFMAQKGYIVFTLDGRGTDNRGKDFSQATHRQLGTKEMEDQLSGVKYLKTLKYVDTTRLGVFGWSYGGFMTTSLMTRYPNVFKVGVAGGPVIDWNYYEIMYTERYMDSPQDNPDGYKNNSLLNYADKLKGKLLMIHGAQDPVVVMQHSMLFQKKAIESKVQLDYFLYPGHEHNIMGKDRVHLMTKVLDYFLNNL